VVDVDFAEDDAAGFGLLRRELFEDGGDDFAGTALWGPSVSVQARGGVGADLDTDPVGVEVGDDVSGRGKGLFEVRRGGDGDDLGRHDEKCEG
jgi:hypothetical protein